MKLVEQGHFWLRMESGQVGTGQSVRGEVMEQDGTFSPVRFRRIRTGGGDG
jgi:hypothetical protein